MPSLGQAALRFSLEHDASEWQDRLHLYYLEMCDLPSVERFCDQFLADDSVVRLKSFLISDLRLFSHHLPAVSN